MPGKFGGIKFNLLRALELFGDMNHLDMEVTAPPSSPDHFKEYEVARRLNACLNQMIDDGVFEDCDYRDVSTSNESLGYDDDSMEDEYVNSRSTTSSVTSRGFDTSHLRSRDDHDGGSSNEGTSNDDESTPSGSEQEDRNSGRSSLGRFRVRFKRYIRRILPGANNLTRVRSEPLRDDEMADNDSLSGPDLDQMSTSQPSDDDGSASGSLSASGSVRHELVGSQASSLGSGGNSLLSATSSGNSSVGGRSASLGSSGSARGRSRTRSSNSGSRRSRSSRSNSGSGRR